MKIDFSALPETSLEAPRGGSGLFLMRRFQDGDNAIFEGRLTPGSAFGLHGHTSDSETVIILSGKGKVRTPEGEEPVLPGEVHYCPRGASHALVNDGAEDLVFIGLIPKHI